MSSLLDGRFASFGGLIYASRSKGVSDRKYAHVMSRMRVLLYSSEVAMDKMINFLAVEPLGFLSRWKLPGHQRSSAQPICFYGRLRCWPTWFGLRVLIPTHQYSSRPWGCLPFWMCQFSSAPVSSLNSRSRTGCCIYYTFLQGQTIHFLHPSKHLVYLNIYYQWYDRQYSTTRYTASNMKTWTFIVYPLTVRLQSLHQHGCVYTFSQITFLWCN